VQIPAEVEITSARTVQRSAASGDATDASYRLMEVASVSIPGGYSTDMSLVAAFTRLNEKKRFSGEGGWFSLCTRS
jgi:hypothetical protein